jgi:hypothetical protein
MAVSLGEITSIRGDEAIGAGTAGTAANLAQLAPDQLSLGILQNASNARMLANKYAQDQYQKNLDDFFKNDFNNLDVNGIMERDYDVVIPQYAQYAKNIADNMDVIMNPSVDFERYKTLRQQEAQLRGKIAQSKQQLALRTGAQNFISMHPGFQTPQNIESVRAFTDSPMEDRDIGSLVNLQPKYDLMQQDIAKQANTAAMAQTKQQNTASPFMDTVSLTTYYKDAYDNAVRALIAQPDIFNRPMRSVVDNAFKYAPEYIKRQYTDDGTGEIQTDQFAIDQIYGPLRNQDVTSITKEINPIYKADEEQKDALERIAAQGRQQRRTLAFGEALKNEDLELYASQIPVRQHTIFATGSQPIEQAETVQLQGTGSKPVDWTTPGNPGNFGNLGQNGREVKAFPLQLDTWLQNAYSIPTGKHKVVDPVTRQVVEEDSFDRPEAAWVTAERNPNARKVIVRYQTKEGAKDLILPYAQNFQVLGNVAGPTNAVKLGSEAARVAKKYTGKVNPNFEEIAAVPLFADPNVGGPALNLQGEGLLPIPPGSNIPLSQYQRTAAQVPSSATPGQPSVPSLNYADWKKSQGK